MKFSVTYSVLHPGESEPTLVVCKSESLPLDEESEEVCLAAYNAVRPYFSPTRDIAQRSEVDDEGEPVYALVLRDYTELNPENKQLVKEADAFAKKLYASVLRSLKALCV